MLTNKTGSDLLTRLIAASELRARVISANLANQSTPGYTRRVVEFEDQLRSALLKRPDRAGQVTPEVVMDTESPARPDGNNVTLELELNAMRENRLLYETYTSMLRSHFSMIEAAITEGR